MTICTHIRQFKTSKVYTYERTTHLITSENFNMIYHFEFRLIPQNSEHVISHLYNISAYADQPSSITNF